MPLEYLNAALDRAHYEMIEDNEPFYGEGPGVQDVRAFRVDKLLQGSDNTL
jgi:hypothetical protein